MPSTFLNDLPSAFGTFFVGLFVLLAAGQTSAEPIPADAFQIAEGAPLDPEAHLGGGIWLTDRNGNTLRVNNRMLLRVPQDRWVDLYTFHDTNGALVDPGRETARRFATAFEQAQSSGYMGIDPVFVDQLDTYARQMRRLLRGSRMIQWGGVGQALLVRGAGFGVALLSGAPNVLRNMPSYLAGEAFYLYVQAPNVFIYQFALTNLKERADQLAWQADWARDRVQERRGLSAERPLVLSEVAKAYRSAVAIDSLLLPLAELVIAAQMDPSWRAQWDRSVEALSTTTASLTIGTVPLAVGGGVLSVSNMMEDAEVRVPAFGAFAQIARARSDIWKNSRAGDGQSMPRRAIHWVVATPRAAPEAAATARSTEPSPKLTPGVFRPRPGNGWVSSANFSPDGTLIVTTAWDNAHIWSAFTKEKLIELIGHGNAVTSADFSPDGKRIVSSSWDKTARIWDAKSGKELIVLRGHKDLVQSAAFDPTGSWVITSSYDGTARIWDTQTGQEIRVLRGHSAQLTFARFGPEGRRAVTASIDDTIRVWDARSGRELAVIHGHESDVASAEFAPDGSKLVTSSADKTARIWEAGTGRQIKKLVGHTDIVYSAKFSPDGRYIATASYDGTARVWDAETGEQLKLFDKHDSRVYWADFSPDNNWVVSAGSGTAILWEVGKGRKDTLHAPVDTASSAPALPPVTLERFAGRYAAPGQCEEDVSDSAMQISDGRVGFWESSCRVLSEKREENGDLSLSLDCEGEGYAWPAWMRLSSTQDGSIRYVTSRHDPPSRISPGNAALRERCDAPVAQPEPAVTGQDSHPGRDILSCDLESGGSLDVRYDPVTDTITSTFFTGASGSARYVTPRARATVLPNARGHGIQLDVQSQTTLGPLVVSYSMGGANYNYSVGATWGGQYSACAAVGIDNVAEWAEDLRDRREGAEKSGTSRPPRGEGQVVINETFSGTSGINWTRKMPTRGPRGQLSTDGAFHVVRRGAGGSGQAIQLTTVFNEQITGPVTISFEAAPIMRTVRNGCGDKCLEFPVMVRLEVEDTAGARHFVHYGVNYGNAVRNVDMRNRRGDMVYGRSVSRPKGEMSPVRHVLQDTVPDAARLVGVSVMGRGWDFEGKLDNLKVEMEVGQ